MTPEYRVLDDSPITVQKTLNQWAHQYELVLHNPRYIMGDVNDGTYCVRIVVMVQRTKRV